jgi:hypothetical protein
MAAGPAAGPFKEIKLRVPVTVEAGIYARKDAVARCALNFTELFKSAGATGAALDLNALRVAEADGKGGLTEVPFKFVKATAFDPKTSAQGELLWQAAGEMEPLDTREYWIYFDREGPVKRAAPSYPGVESLSGEPANQVRNPGFEDLDPINPKLPARWQFEGAKPETPPKGFMEVVTEPAHSGKRALKMTFAGGKGTAGCVQTGIPLKPNTLYRASVWAMPGADTKPNLLLLLTGWVRQANGGYVKRGNTKFQIGGALYPGQWTRISTVGIAYTSGADALTPPDAGSCEMHLALYCTHGEEPVGTIYVDDVEIVEMPKENATPPMTVRVGKPEMLK